MRRIIFLMAAAMLLTITACRNAGEQEAPQSERGVGEESSAAALAEEPRPEQPDPADTLSAREEASEDAQPDDGAEPEASAIQLEQAESAPVTDAASEQRMEQAKENVDEAESLRIKLSFGGNEAYATLYDTPPGRDLLSRLPLTLEFQDYVGTEKISYLAEPLTNESGTNPPSAGDFAYYSPWGNLAIFYNDIPSAGGGLVILGSMESGKELLARVTENFTMTMELANW